MYNRLLIILGIVMLLMSLWTWSYITQTPLILMIEDNKYREADCIYVYVPGVKCEEDY